MKFVYFSYMVLNALRSSVHQLLSRDFQTVAGDKISFFMNTIQRFWNFEGKRFHSPSLACVAAAALVCLFGCAEKRNVDPCCTFSEIPKTTEVKDGQGLLQVAGSTSAYYYVLDQTGKQLAYELLNETLPLDPGRYTIKVNNSLHAVDVEEGKLARCATGTLIVSGNTSEYYQVMDSSRQQLGYETLSQSMSFFPGPLRVKVNNTELPVEVRLKELTEVRTGSLVVTGNTGEYYYVLDGLNKQLNYNTLGAPLAFLPGSYSLKVNNTSMKADVIAGQTIELHTGNLMVKGLTEEYYYVTDTLGNALNYQNLNKPLAFFPGKVQIKVNNTLMVGNVAQGQTSEFVTGSLMLTGGGSGYYYVLDQTGNQLNYNSLNKSLSFFPSEYTVKLGSSTRKAIVSAGQLTSISVFN